MKKIFLLFLFAIATCGMMANAENYGINVGGVEVSSSNYSNVTGGDIKSGTVTYNNSTKTLTLTNATVTRTTSSDFAVHNRSCEGLTIVFNGTCNLTSTKAHGLKLDKSTTLNVSSGATANVKSGTGSALYLGNIQVWFKGSGTIKFETTSSSSNACIKGSDVTEAIYDGAHVTATSYDYYAMEMLINTFHSGTDLRLYSNDEKQLVYNCVLQNMVSPAMGAPAILEPYGAYVNTTSRTTIYTSSGSPVIDEDVYISDNYAVLLSSKHFPDANFRNYLLGFYPKGYLSSSEVNSRTSLNVSNKAITYLTGINYFTSLIYLDCSNNNISQLWLLPSTLKELRCSNNQLTTIDLASCSTLTYLDCHNNPNPVIYEIPPTLQTLNLSYTQSGGNNTISNLPALKTIDLSNNSLSSLTIDNCPALTQIDCHNNYLLYIDLYGCPSLKYLYCNNNNLSTQQFSLRNLPTTLVELDLSSNQLYGEYIITDRSSLTKLDCQNNPNLKKLVCMDNSLSTLYVQNNPALTLINCCRNHELTAIDLTGLDNLDSLVCTNNKLTSLNLSPCTKLRYLRCSHNHLTSLSGIPSTIKTIYCDYNKFTYLNITEKPALYKFDCSSNTSLTQLYVYHNALTSLSVLGCSALTTLYCNGNKLASLSLEGCSALNFITIARNQIKGSNMTNLINTLRTIPTSEAEGTFDVYNQDQASVEGNEITAAQVEMARTKRWKPQKFVNGAWVEIGGGGILGDVNCDGSVNAADITALYNYILNGNKTYLSTSDVNNDNAVNAADITAVYSIILGQN